MENTPVPPKPVICFHCANAWHGVRSVAIAMQQKTEGNDQCFRCPMIPFYHTIEHGNLPVERSLNRRPRTSKDNRFIVAIVKLLHEDLMNLDIEYIYKTLRDVNSYNSGAMFQKEYE